MKATTIQVEENACAMEQNRKRHGTHELLSHSKYVLCPFLLVPLHRHFPSGSKDMQEAWVQFLGQEDPLKKGMAIHSSILAWGRKESDRTEQLTL